jgi:hypothetical protein
MYLVDSDVFMQARNRHYGFAFCPGFWAWLDAAHDAGRVASVGKVGDELRAGKDDLATWAGDRSAFFLEPDDAVVTSLRVLSGWAVDQSTGYFLAARNDFLASADYYLIAHAHAQSHVVVTHERSQPDSKRRIKIPDACAAFGVKCIDPFEMLRGEDVRLVLAPSS